LSKPDTPTLMGRVLIADDLPDSARSLAILLEMHGAEVRIAFDGAQTVRAAEDFLPEIVLMDISMPGMSGYDVARAIRGSTWGRTMILIALTGWGRIQDLEAAREAGFDHHLLKPVDPEQLLEVISNLREQRARRPAR
jgi:CheY-like chemotaxis protein